MKEEFIPAHIAESGVADSRVGRMGKRAQISRFWFSAMPRMADLTARWSIRR